MYNKKIKAAAQACIEFMEEDNRITFVHLEHIMRENDIVTEDFPIKSLSYSLEGYKNIFLWVFSSIEATQVFQEIYLLLKSENKKIFFRSCSPYVYLKTGEMLLYPFATAVSEYGFPHWLPVTLSIQEQNGKTYKTVY